ncbi:MAG TPA: sigma-54 dependent transcriptional regulator [Candidatus Acidoferrales bacterium]|jgi:two-component system response regulator AtoC|nr:sigma-54 dependent transcriptional regulator [Candidatus Acidoferrales bacterium]
MASATKLKAEVPVRAVDLPPDHIYFGPSQAMQAVRQRVERAAALNVPILILGESGTGKEVLARFVHNRSPWAGGPFIKVNCPAIPGTLLESELFGFEKGAFTGATAAKPGRIEMAEGGTLFLDEIAELDASLQAKLLHVLQDGHFTRIGDHEERRMNSRVICATNRALQEEIEKGGFRSDLFYRINVISVTLPSLRDRREDVPYLAEYLRVVFNQRFQREAPKISKETLHTLQQRDWPGNVRELENCIARYVVLGSEDAFYVERIEKKPYSFTYEESPDGNIPLKAIAQQVTRRMEHDVILKVLQANHWNRRKAAEQLKISYRALLYKVRQAGLPSKRPRRPPETETVIAVPSSQAD